MFNVGDYIIYGHTGVCNVKDVGYPEFKGIDCSRLYYTLIPENSTEIIYTPVNSSVYMRPVMSREEAIELIRQIPEIEDTVDDEIDFGINSKEWQGIYKSLLDTHDSEDLVRLLITIHMKRENLLQNKKIINQTDRNTMRDAKTTLYGELAVALGILQEDVPSFIEEELEVNGECEKLKREN
jgi:CarD family transcriptional regulator